MRAIRARYNPTMQAKSRMDQLRDLGHSVDKVRPPPLPSFPLSCVCALALAPGRSYTIRAAACRSSTSSWAARSCRCRRTTATTLSAACTTPCPGTAAPPSMKPFGAFRGASSTSASAAHEKRATAPHTQHVGAEQDQVHRHHDRDPPRLLPEAAPQVWPRSRALYGHKGRLLTRPAARCVPDRTPPL